MIIDPVLDKRHTSPVRRITEGGLHWRVMVETWHDSDAYHGRLLFRRDEADGAEVDRETAALLHGPSREDVVALAHDYPEERLRRLLYSMG